MVEASLEAYPLQTEGVVSSLLVGINGNLGKFFKILMQKVYEKVKKICCVVNVLCISGGKFL